MAMLFYVYLLFVHIVVKSLRIYARYPDFKRGCVVAMLFYVYLLFVHIVVKSLRIYARYPDFKRDYIKNFGSIFVSILQTAKKTEFFC